ncbi:MFS transporter [Kingella negevensis]|uniref:MFS transporter n=1 Tax=Kingella negevensis TaxID=1522312 RepID=UPI00254E7EF2|nr:MFS transporter [Kingella negevensis]MDK4681335.1 MFS transporter [Kingella negevensis]MDK4683532.1 MFS transporter [Kingella negevensis]MDK4691333.1 MFS transporter [Kingella negevensis]MDK4693518.1 MFS transporter [Kingella negevensis]MDK4700131.1 MFS transporter [Kingella negevensis]
MDLKQKIFNSPMTGFQWLVVALAVMLNMLDGFDVLAIAFTAKSIKSELGLTGAQIGSLISAGTVGMMAGSFTLGPLADKLGRRPVLILSTVLSAIGMLMTYFSHSVAAIAFSRVITGIGVGGILPCTNVIVSEYANKKWRGLAIAIYASGFGIGATLGGISAVSLQAQYGWRAVFLVGAGLTMFAFVALLTLLPESVEFLLNKQPENAKARLDKIAAKIGIADDWTFSVQAATKQQKVSFLRLFEKDNIRTTLLIWLAFVAVTSSYYFISSWTPALLEEAGMQKTQSQTVGMAIAIGGAAGSLLFGFLVSRWDARRVLLAFTVLSAVSVCVFVVTTSITLSLALVLAIGLGALANGCITGLYTINPTLYDTDFRSTGVSVAIGVGRVGAMASPVLVGFLLDDGWQKNQLYYGAAIIFILATIAVGALKQKQ